MTDAHTDSILRRKEVQARTGWARSTIYQAMAEGRFPKAIHLGPRSVGWLASEVDSWIAERVAQSRPAAPAEARP